MSICPDKIVISEYVDGQLPSPWKEKLEQHIAECPKCKAELEKYKKLGAILKQPGIEETRDFDYDLSFKKLDAKLHDVKKHGSRTEEVKTHFWHKTIRLPAPMLVAAVLVVLFLPPFTFFAAMSQKQQTQSIAYPLFQASSGVVRATNASQKQLDFNSGVSGFLRFYMQKPPPQIKVSQHKHKPQYILIYCVLDIFSQTKIHRLQPQKQPQRLRR